MPYPIKSIGEVKLKDEALFITGYARVNGFLDEENGIRDQPLRYESTLIFQDEVVYVWLEASGQDFGDDFVKGVVERDWSESGKGGRMIFFGYEG